jgi:hypothetical protein
LWALAGEAQGSQYCRIRITTAQEFEELFGGQGWTERRALRQGSSMPKHGGQQLR